MNQYTAITNPAVSPAHDGDGNMTFDGEWTYTWNADNRLIAIENATHREEYDYDYMGRRWRLKTFAKSGTDWTLTVEKRFVYDGYRQIAEFTMNGTTPTLTASYLWQPGLDGIVLRATFGTTVRYFVPDGNRNVLQLRDASGTVTDSYAYGPFGQCAATGATPNPFRFSCEYLDTATGLVYYNYRHYHPMLGRWTSRDQADIDACLNIYAFCLNAPPFIFDIDGQWSSLPFFPFNDHNRLTINAFEQLKKSLSKIYSRRELWVIQTILIQGNIKTDRGAYFDKLQYHFNREPEEDIHLAQMNYLVTLLYEISQFFIGLESIGDHDPCCNETATRNACKTELLRLGRITHMLQDFFAHGIVEEKSDSFWHPEGRLPENANPFMPFSVIPSSYSTDERPFMLFFDNYYLGNEEHGGLLNREPGNRAVDHDLRKERSIQWTKFFLESMLPLWSEKCQKCVNKIIPPPPPRHDHGSISHGR